MRMNKMKKILSLLLTAIMCISLCAIPVSANEVDYTCYEGTWNSDEFGVLTISDVADKQMDIVLNAPYFDLELTDAVVQNNCVYGEAIDYNYSGRPNTYNVCISFQETGIKIEVEMLISIGVTYTSAKETHYFRKDGFTLWKKENINVTVNGSELKFDQNPVMKNDRVLVPIRKICDAIGAEIYYQSNGEDKIISIIKGDTLITLTNGLYKEYDFIPGNWLINKRTLSENEYELCNVLNTDEDNKTLDAEPIILNGRTLVPVRVITEYLGAEVDWVQDTKTVEIKISDTEFKRSTDEIERINDFTKIEANYMFINLPHSYKVYIEETGYYFCVEAFNKNGKVCVYEKPEDASQRIMMYHDGTIKYVQADKISLKHN